MADFGTVDHVLFFGRAYDEIMELLLLDQAKLTGKKILDCPSGSDGLRGRGERRDRDVTGCDPLFDRPARRLAEIARRDIQQARDRLKPAGVRGDCNAL